MPTSSTSVASLVAGVLFVLAIGSTRDSDSTLGFLFWNESVLKKDLPILKRGWLTIMSGGNEFFKLTSKSKIKNEEPLPLG